MFVNFIIIVGYDAHIYDYTYGSKNGTSLRASYEKSAIKCITNKSNSTKRKSRANNYGVITIMEATLEERLIHIGKLPSSSNVASIMVIIP